MADDKNANIVLTVCTHMRYIRGNGFASRGLVRLVGGPMNPLKRAWLLLFLMVITGSVHAQGVGSSGDIAGTISDPSGARIPKDRLLCQRRSEEHTSELQS